MELDGTRTAKLHRVCQVSISGEMVAGADEAVMFFIRGVAKAPLEAPQGFDAAQLLTMPIIVIGLT